MEVSDYLILCAEQVAKTHIYKVTAEIIPFPKGLEKVQIFKKWRHNCNEMRWGA